MRTLITCLLPAEEAATGLHRVSRLLFYVMRVDVESPTIVGSAESLSPMPLQDSLISADAPDETDAALE